MQLHGSKYFARSPPTPPPTLGSKGQILLLQNRIMLHIKLKGIANAAAW